MAKKFIRKHRHKIVVGAPIIFLFVLNATGAFGGNILILNAENSAFVSVGDAVPIRLEMFTKTPVNAVGGTVTYQPEILHANSITRTTSVIDLWSEEPLIAHTDGTIHWSGGIVTQSTDGSARGPVFVMNFRALTSGRSRLAIKDGALLANDGEGTNVFSGANTLTVYVREQGLPSPDINQDGILSLSDANSLYLATFRTYEKKYDQNGDGKVAWDDVRMLIGLL
jgi:hypothetical protein